MSRLPSAREFKTILIADDHALIRIGLREQLSQLGRFRVLEAWDVPSLEACIQEHPLVDLILLDLMMPGGQDDAWVDDFCALHSSLRILFLTGQSLAMVTARFQGFPNVMGAIDKGRSPEVLRQSVDLALSGYPVWPAPGSAAHGPTSAAPSRAGQLTERQREVALLVARGRSNKDVATALSLSEGTVKNHVRDIFRVLCVTNRTQLALQVLSPQTEA